MRAPHPRGFTLVEVLVALFIMAVLAGFAWQGVDGMLRTRSTTQAALDRSMRLATVVTQWEQDLAALFDSASAPALQFDGRTLRLVREAPGGVRVVAWSLHDGAWTRWAGPVTTQADALQEQWLHSQQLLGHEAGQLRAVDGVSAWQLYYFRGNAWSNAQSSGDLAAPAAGAASAPTREALPSAIRMVLHVDAGPLTRDVLVPPQAP